MCAHISTYVCVYITIMLNLSWCIEISVLVYDTLKPPT